MKLKEKDKVIAAFKREHKEIFIATEQAYGLWFDEEEIPSVGLKASGVKSINLKGDKVVSVSNFDTTESEYVSVVTAKGTAKRVKITEFDKSSRAKRGLMLLREVKTNPYKVLKVFVVPTKHMIGLKGNDIDYVKLSEFPIVDRYSTGSTITKSKLNDAFVVSDIVSKKGSNNSKPKEEETVEIIDINEEEPKKIVVEKLVDVPEVKVEKPKEEKKAKEKISLKEIDDRLLTIEDFLNSD